MLGRFRRAHQRSNRMLKQQRYLSKKKLPVRGEWVQFPRKILWDLLWKTRQFSLCIPVTSFHDIQQKWQQRCFALHKMLGYWWFIVRIWRIFVSQFLIDLSSFSPCSWRDLFPEKSSESRLTEKSLHKSEENYRQLQKIVAGHSVHNKNRFKNSQPKPVIIPLIEISCSKFCEIISHGDIPSGASTLWCHP